MCTCVHVSVFVCVCVFVCVYVRTCVLALGIGCNFQIDHQTEYILADDYSIDHWK